MPGTRIHGPEYIPDERLGDSHPHSASARTDSHQRRHHGSLDISSSSPRIIHSVNWNQNELLNSLSQEFHAMTTKSFTPSICTFTIHSLIRRRTPSSSRAHVLRTITTASPCVTGKPPRRWSSRLSPSKATSLSRSYRSRHLSTSIAWAARMSRNLVHRMKLKGLRASWALKLMQCERRWTRCVEKRDKALRQPIKVRINEHQHVCSILKG